MREILFRGKDQMTGKWHIGSSAVIGIDRLGNTQIEIMQADGSRVIVDWESVGQYTGLTDKNGTKIFEGDIISAYLDGYYPESKYEARYTAAYGKHAFWGKSESGGYYYYLDEEMIDDFEIIGNIYDNPELSENSDNSC